MNGAWVPAGWGASICQYPNNSRQLATLSIRTAEIHCGIKEEKKGAGKLIPDAQEKFQNSTLLMPL
jgi:hypothetical protein